MTAPRRDPSYMQVVRGPGARLSTEGNMTTPCRDPSYMHVVRGPGARLSTEGGMTTPCRDPSYMHVVRGPGARLSTEGSMTTPCPHTWTWRENLGPCLWNQTICFAACCLLLDCFCAPAPCRLCLGDCPALATLHATTLTEVAAQTCCLTQSRYADTVQSNSNTDSKGPAVWQGSQKSTCL